MCRNRHIRLLGAVLTTTCTLLFPQHSGAQSNEPLSSSGANPLLAPTEFHRASTVASPLPSRRRSVAGPLKFGSEDRGPVVAHSDGSELLVVQVPIPPAVRWEAIMSRRPAQYRVNNYRHVQVVGKAIGVVDVTRDSSLVLPMRLARRTPAGRTLGATVEFTVGTASGVVPVEIDVPPRRKLELSMAQRAVVATRGAWTSARLRIQNDGNVVERAVVQIDVPSGWRAQLRSSAPDWRLDAGASLDATVRVWVPKDAGSGVVIVPVSLVRDDGTKSTTPVQLDILGTLITGGQGPTLTATVVSSRTGNLAPGMGYGLTLSGNLSDSTTVSGRLTYSGQENEVTGAGFALARAGVITAPPTLDLEHPRARLSVGATGGMLPELGGQFISGVGAIAGLSGKRWGVRAFGLSPMALQNPYGFTARAPGLLGGGELSLRSARGGTIAAFASHLSDPSTRRSLDAIGVRTTFGNSGTRSLTSEVAFRDYGDGAGVGLLSAYRHSGRIVSLDVRAMHAPGGSRGFARAANELAANGSLSLGSRGTLSSGAWLQDDDNSVIGSAESRGWYVTPSFQLRGIGMLGVEVRGTSFAATTGMGRLSSSEVASGGSLSRDVFGFQLTARSLLGQVTRSLLDSTIATQRDVQLRLEHLMVLSRSASFGTAQASWSHQQYSGAAGLMPSQQSLHLRVDRLQALPSLPVFFHAEAQRVQVGAGRSPYWIARSGVSLPLPGSASVTFSAERNPFIVGATENERQPLLFSMRVDRATTFARPFATGRGQVFRDDNGNGSRDNGERGVAGVVIKCGAQRVMSDRHGRYACGAAQQMVDVRTIPMGLVATSASVNVGAAVALKVMQPLEVMLRVAAADSFRISTATLAKAIVFVRDEEGAQWFARPTTDGRFVVDALPVGRYVVGVDASTIDEPLSLVERDPQVRVDANSNPGVVQLTLRARPLRIRTFEAAPASPSGTPGSASPSSKQAPTPTTTPRTTPAPLSRNL